MGDAGSKGMHCRSNVLWNLREQRNEEIMEQQALRLSKQIMEIMVYTKYLLYILYVYYLFRKMNYAKIEHQWILSFFFRTAMAGEIENNSNLQI